MVRVKICGITNIEDALLAVKLGADALGFIFAESPRRVDPETVAGIVSQLPPFVSKVGVFVDEDKEMVAKIAHLCGLDTLQFHGVEPPEYCARFQEKVIKALRVKNAESLEVLSSYSVDAFLLDTHVEGVPGGTGITFDWSFAVEAKKYGRIILSGGLNPENVAEAIKLVRPYAVDVSSGVEMRTGKKDPEKLKAFIERVKDVTR
jgi:phosphoribosylanthranilate isomerase